MNPKPFDTLIISDTHIGYRGARVPELLELLRKPDFLRLVLLGDIFHDTGFSPETGTLVPDGNRFLDAVRELKKQGVEVVWIVGNHDRDLIKLSPLAGIPILREYSWEYRGKRHLAVHGDTFFDFEKEIPILLFCYVVAEWVVMHTGGKRWLKFAKRILGGKPTRRTARGAFAYAKEKGAARVFCGHTHVEYSRVENGIEYWNSGTWLDEPSPYLAVGVDGVRLRYA